MNLFDYRRLLKKVLAVLAAGIIVFAIGMTLVTLVLQPIIWVTNMLGRISEMLDFNPQGAEKITDYREDLDKLTEDNHIAFRYSDMLACSMNEKYTHDIKGCAAFLQEDGTFEESIDLGPAESFRLYSKEIDEYQGKIPDSAYEDIWIPTLYEMDHYKEKPVIDEETGQPKKNANGEVETEWVFDYTEEEQYKDYCVAYEPETKCRKTREGFFTFPYIPPAGGDIQKRYGYDLTDVETSISLQFKTAVGYGPGYVLAVSTGNTGVGVVGTIAGAITTDDMDSIGKGIDIRTTIKTYDPDNDLEMKAYLNGHHLGEVKKAVDIKILKKYSDKSTADVISELGIDSALVFNDLPELEDGKEYIIVTKHNGNIKVIPVTYKNSQVIGYTKEYSSFVLTTRDKAIPMPEPSKKSSSGSSTPNKDNVVTCQMAGFPANYAWNEVAKACQPGYLDANGVFRSTATAKKVGVPNTYDRGLTGSVVSLIASTVFAVFAAFLLKKYN